MNAYHTASIFETNAATDGLRRLIVYNQVGDFPLVLGVGQSIDDDLLNWRRGTLAVSILLGLLCVMAVVLTQEMVAKRRRPTR